jgi:hypothetical protein
MRWFITLAGTLMWFIGYTVLPNHTSSDLILNATQLLGLSIAILSFPRGRPVTKPMFLLLVGIFLILLTFSITHLYWLYIPFAVLLLLFWRAEHCNGQKAPK